MSVEAELELYQQVINRGFAEWGDVFGDPVVATAILDRLLHHAIVVQIEGLATGFASMLP